jgi:putative ATP-dependent endonuclease of OLD family
MTVLVGANNAGKTNIISAINFLIGDRYPLPGNLEDKDYYNNNRTREIRICLDFEDAPYSRVEFNTGRSPYPLQAYDTQGAIVRGFTNDQRARLAFAYVDAGRNFDRQFGASRYSIFGQAIRLLHDDLRQNGGKLPDLRRTLEHAHELLRTNLYKTFEEALREAFTAQLRTSRYDVQFEFRTLDETNLYRGLYPTLIERGQPRAPGEAGSGIRNLLVLALFHAFAKSFRGGALMGIEEPELYLHPHAQRSLMTQFEELVTAGNQVFLSSHSATFLDITRPDRIVIVRRCEDDESEICTQVSTTTLEDLLAERRKLHPGKPMTVDSLRAFLRNVRTAEMAEPYFSRLVVVAEGPSEREALPIFCIKLGLNLDEEGVSVVAAGGKTVIDTLVQLYRAHDVQTYVIFDNDENKQPSERQANLVITRLLGLTPSDLPSPAITRSHAVLAGDWERQMRSDLEVQEPGLYDRLLAEARTALGVGGGKNKPLIARYIAEKLADFGKTPRFVREIAGHLRDRLGVGLPPEEAPEVGNDLDQFDGDLDDEIPF